MSTLTVLEGAEKKIEKLTLENVELRTVLVAAKLAFLSYLHGNASPVLAEDLVKAIDTVIGEHNERR